MDCSLLGYSVHEISQAGILEWVAISSSRGSSGPRNQTPDSCLLSPVSPALAGGFFTVEPPGKSQTTEYTLIDSFSTEPVSQLLVLASVSSDGHWGYKSGP